MISLLPKGRLPCVCGKKFLFMLTPSGPERTTRRTGDIPQSPRDLASKVTFHLPDTPAALADLIEGTYERQGYSVTADGSNAPLDTLRRNWYSGEGAEDAYDWLSRARVDPGFMAHLLSGLPGEVVADEFGTELALLSVAYARDPKEVIGHRQFMEAGGVDPDRFIHAVRVARKFSKAGNLVEFPVILRQYDVFERTVAQDTAIPDLPSILAGRIRYGFRMTAREMPAFSMDILQLPSKESETCGPHLAENRKLYPSGEAKKRFDIFLDSPSGIVLRWKGMPVAVASFHVADIHTLHVNQLQGVKGIKVDNSGTDVFTEELERIRVGSRGLMKLQFREVLVDSVEQFARSLGFERISIEGAVNNRWTRNYDGVKARLSLERARESYDRVASKLGYTEGPDKNWHKLLD